RDLHPARRLRHRPFALSPGSRRLHDRTEAALTAPHDQKHEGVLAPPAAWLSRPFAGAGAVARRPFASVVAPWRVTPLVPREVSSVWVGKTQELVVAPPVRESGATEQEAEVANRRRQGGDLGNDSGPLVRDPHDLSPF